jgi:hypothetical protein
VLLSVAPGATGASGATGATGATGTGAGVSGAPPDFLRSRRVRVFMDCLLCLFIIYYIEYKI